MGIEALRDEEIVVKRPDAKELLEIRAGAWTYEEVVAYFTLSLYGWWYFFVCKFSKRE